MSSHLACKVDGCSRTAVAQRGVFAGLCAAHRDEKRAAREPRSTSSGPLTVKARNLVKLAAALDRARAQLATMPATAEAKAEFDEATRRASQSPTNENLSRVGGALKQLQAGAPRRAKVESDVAQAERALGLALQSFISDARTSA